MSIYSEFSSSFSETELYIGLDRKRCRPMLFCLHQVVSPLETFKCVIYPVYAVYEYKEHHGGNSQLKPVRYTKLTVVSSVYNCYDVQSACFILMYFGSRAIDVRCV